MESFLEEVKGKDEREFIYMRELKGNRKKRKDMLIEKEC